MRRGLVAYPVLSELMASFWTEMQVLWDLEVLVEELTDVQLEVPYMASAS